MMCIVFACVWILHVNLTLPELTLFIKQEYHDWSLLNNYKYIISPHVVSPPS